MKLANVEWNPQQNWLRHEETLYMVLAFLEEEKQTLLLLSDGESMTGGYLENGDLILDLSGSQKARLMQKMMEEMEVSTELEESIFHLR